VTNPSDPHAKAQSAIRFIVFLLAEANRSLPSSRQAGTVTQVPFVHVPLQQSAFDAQARPVGLQGSEQLPPTQRPLQQSILERQTPVVGVQPIGGWHDGGVPEQSSPQHSALKLQLAPVAAQGSWHVRTPWSFGWHLPLQQSASVAQPAPLTWQVPAPWMQIGGFCVVSQTSQHPLPLPELHVSPVGRQSVLL